MSVRDKIAKALAGIKAYHSSPHDFDKFDLAKIGTGEGAQVYGHGLYFAESPAVSGQGGQYWDQFLPRFDTNSPERRAAEYLKMMGFDRSKAAAKAADDAAFYAKDGNEIAAKKYGEAARLLESGAPVGPRTYEVNINADPAHMLDWDRPLKLQPRVFENLESNFVLPIKPEMTGQELHKTFADYLTKPRASERMAEAGIPGIKYLDQGSRITSPVAERILEKAGSRAEALKIAEERLRTAGMGDLSYWDSMVKQFQPETSNYVIFDPNLIRIDKKYAVPGAVGATGVMGALADESRYEVPQ
jgi:hypothetical protein